MSFAPRVTVSGNAFHTNVASAPPVGTVIRYSVSATSGTISHFLDKGGGTQNGVYVGIASGPEGDDHSYAKVAKVAELTLLHLVDGSWGRASDGSWDSGDLRVTLHGGASIRVGAAILVPAP